MDTSQRFAHVFNCVYLCVVSRHEIAEAAGLISQAFGTEEVDRHIVLFKKVSRVNIHTDLF